jgi:tRNA(fMet)-specific endonuclease VapC
VRTAYLLDTNAVIAVLNGDATVRQRLRNAMKSGDIFISSVALFELWYGVARSARRAENTERLRVFLSGAVGHIPFDEDDAAIAGDIRFALESTGTPIGPFDLLIAAQALRMGATLVTANVGEFSRVQGLVWENWKAA